MHAAHRRPATEDRRERFDREFRLLKRLRLSASRVETAHQEQLWAIVGAYQQGVSVRAIGDACGLSKSRIHQILKSQAAEHLPDLLERNKESIITDENNSSIPESEQQIRDELLAECALLRKAIKMLIELEKHPAIPQPLMPDSDSRYNAILFDRPRVVKLLERIEGDLEFLARQGTPVVGELDDIPREKYWRKLAEPPPYKKKTSPRKQLELLKEYFPETFGP